MFVCLLSFATAAVLIEPHQEKAFLSWMREHSVTYTGEEYFLRLGVYLSNAKYVQNFNKQKKSFKLALNKFATWTPAEYRTLLSKVPLTYQKHDKSRKCTLKEIPDEIDWRDQNIVTPVVDQMMCASGWCFASTTAQESQWARVKGELMKLSDQNLIECCWTNQNCEGGWADAAAYYVLENQGGKYMLASDWPYTGYFSDQCNFDASKGVQNLVEVLYAKSGDEQDMKEKCAEYGVLATAIDASLTTFVYYKSGVYDDEACDPWSLDHCIAIVGYGTLEGVDYWLCKNSYGDLWGDKGYIKMIRNKSGQCGIDMQAYVPIVE